MGSRLFPKTSRDTLIMLPPILGISTLGWRDWRFNQLDIFLLIKYLIMIPKNKFTINKKKVIKFLCLAAFFLPDYFIFCPKRFSHLSLISINNVFLTCWPSIPDRNLWLNYCYILPVINDRIWLGRLILIGPDIKNKKNEIPGKINCVKTDHSDPATHRCNKKFNTSHMDWVIKNILEWFSSRHLPQYCRGGRGKFIPEEGEAYYYVRREKAIGTSFLKFLIGWGVGSSVG